MLNGSFQQNLYKARDNGTRLILRHAISAYSGFNSTPTHRLPISIHTSPTVPEPKNGSRIRDSGLLPANTQGFTSEGGNTAKCAPLKLFVLMDHTDRLLRFLFPVFVGSFMAS